MNYMLYIIIFGMVVVGINAVYNKWLKQNNQEKFYRAISGDYKGQTHNIKDWRKIAVELSKTVKNSRLNAMAKHGTDEDIIGLLFINFGVELVDYEEIMRH